MLQVRNDLGVARGGQPPHQSAPKVAPCLQQRWSLMPLVPCHLPGPALDLHRAHRRTMRQQHGSSVCTPIRRLGHTRLVCNRNLRRGSGHTSRPLPVALLRGRLGWARGTPVTRWQSKPCG